MEELMVLRQWENWGQYIESQTFHLIFECKQIENFRNLFECNKLWNAENLIIVAFVWTKPYNLEVYWDKLFKIQTINGNNILIIAWKWYELYSSYL